MKQLVYGLFASLILVVGLTACGQSTDPSSQTNGSTATSETENVKEEVTVTISKDNGAELVSEKQIKVTDGQTVMDIMKENFKIETASNGGFINSIEGIAPKDGEQKAWFYSVNGEEAMVGAKEYTLSPGDQVTFDFHSWE